MKRKEVLLIVRRFAAAICALLLGLPLSAIVACAEAQVHTGTVEAQGTVIRLDGDMAVLPLGVRAEGDTVTVEKAGTYWFTGEFEDGQIVVDAGGKDQVTLVLDGVSLLNGTQPAIYVKKAKLTTLVLPEGSANRVQSGEIAALDGSAIDPDAQGGAIQAKDDLAIEGDGELWVGGYVNNGIHTSNHLTISGGKLTVEAVNNGIKGKDSVTIVGGEITIRSGGDGVTSDDTTGEGYGVVTVAGGSLNVQSAEDGIQAETLLEISGGTIDVTAGGGSANASAKAQDEWGFGGGFGNRGGGFGGFGGGRGGFGGGRVNDGGGRSFGGRGFSEDTDAANEMNPPEISDMPGEMNPPESMKMPEGLNPPEGMEMPEGMNPPEGMDMPEGMNPPEGMDMPEGMNPPEGMDIPEGMNPPENMDVPDGLEAQAAPDRMSDFGGRTMQAASQQDDGESNGSKGLKSGALLRISGGTVTVDAADDAVHSNGSIEMTGGALTLSSGDDGMHADESLTVDGGTIDILTSYEGIEANQIGIGGGTIDIMATDDGLNANGGQVSWGRRGPANWDVQEDGEMPNLLITGGTLHVNAQGDGLDSNGNILVKGGVIVVDGPSGSGNGALDSGTEAGGTCEVHGGTVLAIGSSGMAETFGDRSTQVSFQYDFAQTIPEGSAITVALEDGTVLFTHTSAKEFASVVFSCPELEQGDTVILTAGDQSAELTLEDVSTRFGVTRGWGWR